MAGQHLLPANDKFRKTEAMQCSSWTSENVMNRVIARKQSGNKKDTCQRGFFKHKRENIQTQYCNEEEEIVLSFMVGLYMKLNLMSLFSLNDFVTM